MLGCAIPGHIDLICIIKGAKQASRRHSFLVSASISTSAAFLQGEL